LEGKPFFEKHSAAGRPVPVLGSSGLIEFDSTGGWLVLDVPAFRCRSNAKASLNA